MKEEGNKRLLLAVVLILGITMAVNYFTGNITGGYHRWQRLSLHPVLPILGDDAEKEEVCLTSGRFVKPACDGYEAAECAKEMPDAKEGYEWKAIGRGDCDEGYACYCRKKDDEEIRTIHWKKEILDDGSIATVCELKITELASERLPVNIIVSARYEDPDVMPYGLRMIDFDSGEKIYSFSYHNGMISYITRICEDKENGCTYRPAIVFPNENVFGISTKLKCLTASPQGGKIGDVCLTNYYCSVD